MKFKLIIIFIIFNAQMLLSDDIAPGLYGEYLIEYLRSEYKTNTTLSYSGSREALYSEIDNVNNNVYGIYTNYSVYLPENNDEPIAHLYENGMDCEHVWPQSLYEGTNPMKSDMHHLRPSKSNVNSARGNKAFNNVIDSEVTTWYWLDYQSSNIPSSNLNEYSENHNTFFEPREDRKGDIARTIFYFYTMYSENADEDFFLIQKDILKTWHEQDPSDETEINRSWNIAQYQEDKPNPFVLDSTLICRAYFSDCFMYGDINNDGILNILDVVELVNIVLDDIDTIESSDVNQDGITNILDIITLINIILS